MMPTNADNLVSDLGSPGSPEDRIPRWNPMKAARSVPGALYKDDTLAFLHTIGNLKQQPRQGWVRAGVSKVESVADHSWRMAMMAMSLPLPANTDKNKCIRMCLIHDIGESLVGDITPFDGVSKDEKRQRESDALRHIVGLTPNPDDETLELWQEYEEHVSPESQWAHDLDKLDLLLQMVEYEKSDNTLDLGDFSYVSKKLTTAAAHGLAERILKEREEYWNGKEHKRGELDGGAETSVRKAQDGYYQSKEAPPL